MYGLPQTPSERESARPFLEFAVKICACSVNGQASFACRPNSGRNFRLISPAPSGPPARGRDIPAGKRAGYAANKRKRTRKRIHRYKSPMECYIFHAVKCFCISYSGTNPKVSHRKVRRRKSQKNECYSKWPAYKILKTASEWLFPRERGKGEAVNVWRNRNCGDWAEKSCWKC